jgi:biopolymer transport protein ExbB
MKTPPICFCIIPRLVGLSLGVAGCIFLAGSAATAQTNDLLAPIEQAQADLKAAQAQLQSIRARIDQERLPLREAHRALTASVREKRDRLRTLQEAGRMETETHERLEREVARLTDEQRFVMTALTEYRRGLETRMQTAEVQGLADSLAPIDAALRGDENSMGDAVSVVLETALAWSRRRAGGFSFAGAALDASGCEVRGRYRLLGPLVYFAGENGTGGLVTGTPGSLLPSVFSGHKPLEQRSIAALVGGSMSVAVPVDVSGGAALMREGAAESLGQQIRKGGFVMVPLLLTGVLSLLIGSYKFAALHGLHRSVAAPLDAVTDCVRQKDWTGAEVAAGRLRPPLAILITEALAHRHAAREHLEEILHERLLSMTPAWESHIGTLAVFGAVAPLLGLLGTVTGMIHTFELVTLFGTGEARLLSGGISEALITTKFGLGIAIPVLVAHAFLVRRLRVITGTLEEIVARFANQLVDEAAA